MAFMVGAQLLNEAYQKEFSHTEKRVIFLPGCMTAHEKGKCQIKESYGAYKCQGCTKDCSVNQIQQIASLFQAETVILYHESSLNRQKVTKEQGKVGVIGVACVLNLVSGGFKAKRLGYVPQCVLLDYCGCSQHWSKKRLVTKLNQTQLRTILSRSYKNK